MIDEVYIGSQIPMQLIARPKVSLHVFQMCNNIICTKVKPFSRQWSTVLITGSTSCTMKLLFRVSHEHHRLHPHGHTYWLVINDCGSFENPAHVQCCASMSLARHPSSLAFNTSPRSDCKCFLPLGVKHRLCQVWKSKCDTCPQKLECAVSFDLAVGTVLGNFRVPSGCLREAMLQYQLYVQ